MEFDDMIAGLRATPRSVEVGQAADAIEALVGAIRSADDGLHELEGMSLTTYSSHPALIAILGKPE